MNVAGVHAQRRADWIAVRVVDGHIEAQAGPLSEVLAGVDLAVVDVPVRLDLKRDTEREVRALLREPRRHSVFTAPIQAAIGSESFDDANAVSKAAGAPGVPVQMFDLFPHIREAQALRGCDIREGHPELSFLQAHGGPMAHARTSIDGLKERAAVVRAAGLSVPTLAGHARIDVLEACILAWTARRVALGAATSVGNAPLWR